LLLPPAEPLLELPEPDAPDGPLPALAEAPFWPCALLSTAAPVLRCFFFALSVPDGLLSAAPEAEASFDAVFIELSCEELPLMLEVPLRDDFELLDLPAAEPLSLAALPELPLSSELEPLAEPDCEAPLPVLELLPPEP
jgi:hypothetical protein